jgi:hypothetical protein
MTGLIGLWCNGTSVNLVRQCHVSLTCTDGGLCFQALTKLLEKTSKKIRAAEKEAGGLREEVEVSLDACRGLSCCKRHVGPIRCRGLHILYHEIDEDLYLICLITPAILMQARFMDLKVKANDAKSSTQAIIDHYKRLHVSRISLSRANLMILTSGSRERCSLCL